VSDARRAHGYHRLTVKRVVTETGDARSYLLDVPESLRPSFTYQPGQFCTFRVNIDGTEHLRSYSMSSAPGLDPDLTVTVKRVAGGVVSNCLIDSVHEGDELELTRPAGVFCPRDADVPLLGFCGGSGITPVMAIAKHVLARTERRVRLLYANRDGASVIFERALADLAAHYGPRLEVVHHLDSDSGYLSGKDLATFVGDDLAVDCYLCGPGPFMDLAETALRGLGIDPERIYLERFLVEQQEKEEAASSPTGSDVAPAGTDVPEQVTVILNGKPTAVTYQPGDTLLETARRGGLRPPFSCEAGNCATCMAFLKEGTVRMRVNNALTPEEVAEGWVLTCQSLPSGQVVTVEYEAM
jgi:ferredoxin-NADP reductase